MEEKKLFGHSISASRAKKVCQYPFYDNRIYGGSNIW
jgi:hypothetical protein